MGCPTLVPLIELPLPSVISTNSIYGPGIEALSHVATPYANNTWFPINGALLYQITIPSEYTVRSFRWFSGLATAGNWDIGLYDKNFSLLRSAGSTPHPGLNTLTETPVTPLSLQPGSYWIAFVADALTFSVWAAPWALPQSFFTSPVRSAAASFPLPTSIVPAATTGRLFQPLAIANALL